jgi:hypothetical protein
VELDQIATAIGIVNSGKSRFLIVEKQSREVRPMERSRNNMRPTFWPVGVILKKGDSALSISFVKLGVAVALFVEE